MLVIWTTAKPDLIGNTLGRSLRRMGAAKPEHRFVSEVEEAYQALPGEVVLACGEQPLTLLRAAGLAPKSHSTRTLRERCFPRPEGGTYLLTFDPAITRTEPDKTDVIAWDLRLATRLLATGKLDPVLGDYRWVGGFQEIIARIEARFAVSKQPIAVGMDTETMGLNPFDPAKSLVSIAFSDQPGRADCLYLGPFPDPVLPIDPLVYSQIAWLLTSPKVSLRGSNLKYDLVWIAEKLGLDCTSFRFDNCLVGSLLDENRTNSLSLHSKLFTAMGGYDIAFDRRWDKGRMELIPPADLLPYQGADADATLQVSEVFREELLADHGLTRFYLRVLHPASRAFEKIERRGILIDQEKYQALGEHLGTEIRRLELAALDLLPQRLKAKHRDRIADQLGKAKSPFTAKLLEDYFFSPQGLDLHPKMVTEKTGRPSTARAHLRMFAANDDAKAMCETLEALNSAAKTKSTFVDGFLQHLRPDGRLHPSYMLFHGAYNDDTHDESGTVSGRLAAKDPAIQTTPKRTQWAKAIRECFIAPPGKVIVVTDYAQGELKVVACIANEKNMIAAYKEGLDLHAVTGARLGQVPYEEFIAWGKGVDPKLAALYDDLRTRAKAGNFGLLYGMGPEGFRAYAWANYGLQLTLEEALAIHAAFFTMYPGLHTYHDRMRQVARQLKMVRTPLGRIRHLPLIDSPDRGLRARAERQAINSPVQGCLSDMTIWAAALIEAELSPEVEVVGMIHDALINYVPDDDPIFWAGQITQLMSNLPLAQLDWQPQLTFTADAEVGADLAHLKKLVLAA